MNVLYREVYNFYVLCVNCLNVLIELGVFTVTSQITSVKRIPIFIIMATCSNFLLDKNEDNEDTKVEDIEDSAQ